MRDADKHFKVASLNKTANKYMHFQTLFTNIITSVDLYTSDIVEWQKERQTTFNFWALSLRILRM
jgi:hypothetical protein